MENQVARADYPEGPQVTNFQQGYLFSRPMPAEFVSQLAGRGG